MELKLTDAMEIKVRVCCLVILAGGSLNSSFGFFFFKENMKKLCLVNSGFYDNNRSGKEIIFQNF